jgi:hypothetical protein
MYTSHILTSLSVQKYFSPVSCKFFSVLEIMWRVFVLHVILIFQCLFEFSLYFLNLVFLMNYQLCTFCFLEPRLTLPVKQLEY